MYIESDIESDIERYSRRDRNLACSMGKFRRLSSSDFSPSSLLSNFLLNSTRVAIFR